MVEEIGEMREGGEEEGEGRRQVIRKQSSH